MPARNAKPVDTEVHATAAALRVLIGQLRRKLREQARPGDFSNSQLSVLGRLERDGPATVTALARAERMRPQSMGALVAALQSVGFVESSPHPTDGRQVLLSVTPECRAWIKARRTAREDWLSRSIRAKLNAAEQKKLAAAVALLQRIVET
ncbi:MAG TPA: MarR family transcriptional regulator [Rhodanobacteraceae bacterium]|nr:MarR family transcriptional regulator [Rhodanobacteraceae bacterium]